MSRRADVGGRAGTGGFNFQHRVAAYFAVRVLAGSGSTVADLWSGRLARVACETGLPVDDIEILPELGPPVAIQAKRTLAVSGAANSAFGKTLAQFVAHHLMPDHAEDRLVLVVSADAKVPISSGLRRVINSLRESAGTVTLDSVGHSIEDRRIGSALLTHVRRAWRDRAGAHPTDEQVREFLHRVEVLVLDLDDTGQAMISATDLLAGQVVREPGDAAAAWTVLERFCSTLAERGSGASRTDLQSAVASAPIRLQTPPDYRADVQRLKHVTTATLLALEAGELAIPSPEGAISLDRAVATAAVAGATAGSLLVVGEPGVGKSVVLHKLVAALGDEDSAVVAIAVGSTGASSTGELRAEIGLEHDLSDALRSWDPARGGTLVIDALDAARTSERIAMWRGLMHAAITAGWRVVASVRLWDLRHSPELKRLFASDGPELAGAYTDAEFSGVNHVHVGALDDTEVAYIGDRSPILGHLLTDGPPELRLLLRNPFNLRLAAELISVGTAEAEVRSIRTRLELLASYWKHRVSDEPGGVERGAVVERLAAAILAQRTMSISAAEVAQGSGQAITDLLSRHVVVEQSSSSFAPSTGTVRFAHHVLLDYAVAYLALGANADALVQTIRNDPDLVLFARPSFGMRFEDMWEQDRDGYWTTALALASDESVSSIATVAAAEVAARAAQHPHDLASVIAAIDQAATQHGAVRLLHMMTVTVAMDRQRGGSIDWDLWAEVAERLSERLEPAWWVLRALLDEIVRYASPLSVNCARHCGAAACRLFEHEWTRPPAPGTRLTIDAVLATVESDVPRAEALLRRTLEPAQLRERGHSDLHWVARDVGALARHMPAFVEQLYVTCMQYEESSTEVTQFVPSRIVGMTSNRRQDFDMVRWTLVKNFADVIDAAPEHALRALDTLSLAERPPTADPVTLGEGTQAISVVPDDAQDASEHSYNEHDMRALWHKFEDYVSQIIGDEEQVGAFLQVVRRQPRSGAMWRRVLRVLAQARPAARHLASLCSDPVALGMAEVAGPLAALVGAVYTDLSSADQLLVTRAIQLVAPAVPDDGSWEWQRADRQYRRLLAAVPPTVGEDSEFAAARERFAVRERDDQGDWLPDAAWPDTARYHGVDPGNERHEEAWALVENVSAFNTDHLNTVPRPDEVTASVETVRALRETLDGPSPLPDRLRQRAEDVVAEAAERWTRADDLLPDVADYARRLLLSGATSDRPQPRDDEDGTVLIIPPGPRVPAARGLARLVARHGADDTDVRQALRDLTTDAVSVVRLYVVGETPRLERTLPGLGRELLDIAVDRDSSDSVLQTAVHAAHAMYPLDLEEELHIVSRVAARVDRSDRHDTAFEACAEAAGLAWVWHGHPAARGLLDMLLAAGVPPQQPWAALGHELRMSGAFVDDDPAVRARTLQLCGELTEVALTLVAPIASLGDSPDEEEIERIKAGVHLIDSIASQVYFASGSFEGKRAPAADEPPSVSQVRLFGEARVLMSRLSAGLVPAATHHLVETAAHFLDADPRAALALAHELVLAGRAGGYQHEGLAVGALVGMVERLLADHRGLLSEAAALTEVRELLDVFVEVGWPQARRLVYDLEEAFR